MSDLKPCQHCESTQTHFERWLDEVVNGQPSYKVYYRIVCVACEFTPDHWEETAEAAILYWNTRPREDMLLARAEAAERELAEIRMKNERLDVTALLSGMPVITSDAIPDGKIFMSQQMWDRATKPVQPEPPEADHD